MSLLHEAYVIEKFGFRLSVDKMAEALDMSKNTIYNRIAKGDFPIPTYLDGKCRFADYRDFAAYLDSARGHAKTQVKSGYSA